MKLTRRQLRRLIFESINQFCLNEQTITNAAGTGLKIDLDKEREEVRQELVDNYPDMDVVVVGPVDMASSAQGGPRNKKLMDQQRSLKVSESGGDPKDSGTIMGDQVKNGRVYYYAAF